MELWCIIHDQTGRPNVDWCESHRPETVRANVIGTLNLADLCSSKGIHCTIYATGYAVQFLHVSKYLVLTSGGGSNNVDACFRCRQVERLDVQATCFSVW